MKIPGDAARTFLLTRTKRKQETQKRGKWGKRTKIWKKALKAISLIEGKRQKLFGERTTKTK